jgi:hypothetical protein
MTKRSTNFNSLNSKRNRDARSVSALVDAMRAVGMTDAEIRAELLKLQAEREAKRQAAEQPPAPADD